MSQAISEIEETLSVFSRQIDKIQKSLEFLDNFFTPDIILNPPSQYEIDLWKYKKTYKPNPIKIFEILDEEIDYSEYEL